MRVVIQPTGKAGERNLDKTVKKPVAVASLKKHVTKKTFELIRRTSIADRVPIWGIRPGKRNQPEWKQLVPGDLVLFVSRNQISHAGRVTATFRSKPLARHLWGASGDGTEFSLIYVLAECRQPAIELEQLRSWMGLSPNQPFRSFRTLDKEMSLEVISCLDGAIDENVLAQGIINGARELLNSNHSQLTEGFELDDEQVSDRRGKVSAAYRPEQERIRAWLLPFRMASCDICGRTLSRGSIHTAHVKPRSECTLRERRDYRNCTMRACLLGCDYLFEEGWIIVDGEGLIQATKKLPNAHDEGPIIRNLVGRPCLAWSQGSEPYFRWHAEKWQ
jgi:hypothetical protein